MRENKLLQYIVGSNQDNLWVQAFLLNDTELSFNY